MCDPFHYSAFMSHAWVTEVDSEAGSNKSDINALVHFISYNIGPLDT